MSYFQTKTQCVYSTPAPTNARGKASAGALAHQPGPASKISCSPQEPTLQPQLTSTHCVFTKAKHSNNRSKIKIPCAVRYCTCELMQRWAKMHNLRLHMAFYWGVCALPGRTAQAEAVQGQGRNHFSGLWHWE